MWGTREDREGERVTRTLRRYLGLTCSDQKQDSVDHPWIVPLR
jgi:hypothetical protein